MDFIAAFVTLVLVMDPFGNIPVFASVLSRVEPKRRSLVLARELLIAFAILALFYWFGSNLLDFMALDGYSLEIAGGVILFIIALKMIFPNQYGLVGDDPVGGDKEPFIIPLAVPFVAGPSALATAVVLSSQSSAEPLLGFGALAAAWFASSLFLFSSTLLQRVLGERVLRAVERLMGMILTALATQMFLRGLGQYLVELNL